MTVTQTLEHLARAYLPPPAARLAKRIAVYPRYVLQVRACRAGFRRYGHLYPQKLLFVAGMPKSGTTWLERMLSSYPGFHELLIPDVTSHEIRTGGSHNYDLPPDMFNRFSNMLVLTKMHVHGSVHNVDVLRRTGVRYVILYRDVRDVALSHFFYVRQTPWHPEYPIYAPLTLDDTLRTFADRTLFDYVDWIQSWHTNRDPQMSMVVRYEDMLANAVEVFASIAHHFGLDTSKVERIVEQHSFTNLSQGRTQGQENTQSFFRKGIAGDWKNHFSPAMKDLYKQRIGDFLIEYGYEEDLSW
jgi:hypothetical protein